jgi:hypothetical protein
MSISRCTVGEGGDGIWGIREEIHANARKIRKYPSEVPSVERDTSRVRPLEAKKSPRCIDMVVEEQFNHPDTHDVQGSHIRLLSGLVVTG